METDALRHAPDVPLWIPRSPPGILSTTNRVRSPHGHLKGSMYLSTFAFIEHRFGVEAKTAVMRRLSAEDREMLSGIVLPISWYPLAPFGRLLRVMDGELGKGDFNLVTERGEWTA